MGVGVFFFPMCAFGRFKNIRFMLSLFDKL